MKGSFEIEINIMGDVDNKIARVTGFENSSEYLVQMPGDHLNLKVKMGDGGYMVQTEGIPLDSNTLYSITEGIKAKRKK
jgi:hypothetical protein